MGLDMYLTAERYFWSIGDDVKTVQGIAAAAKLELHGSYELKTIVLRVGYWRKANQIHAWFVQKIQDGKDECQRSWVGRDDLRELRELCATVLEHKSNLAAAQKLLPPQEGFFFGGTEIDEGYYEDLEHTVNVLTQVLNDPQFEDSSWDFYYQASW